MGWCCDMPLANGSCAQGFDINVQAGTVLEDNTGTSGNVGDTHVCQTSHDVAVGLGVGIPTVIASLSMLLLYLRERRARRKEQQKPASLNNDEAPWLKSGLEGRSVTTITSEEPPWVRRRPEDSAWVNNRAEAPAWVKNRAEAPGGSSIPHIELEEGPWRMELP
jgi:hypothetical protein